MEVVRYNDRVVGEQSLGAEHNKWKNMLARNKADRIRRALEDFGIQKGRCASKIEDENRKGTLIKFTNEDGTPVGRVGDPMPSARSGRGASAQGHRSRSTPCEGTERSWMPAGSPGSLRLVPLRRNSEEIRAVTPRGPSRTPSPQGPRPPPAVRAPQAPSAVTGRRPAAVLRAPPAAPQRALTPLAQRRVPSPQGQLALPSGTRSASSPAAPQGKPPQPSSPPPNSGGARPSPPREPRARTEHVPGSALSVLIQARAGREAGKGIDESYPRALDPLARIRSSASVVSLAEKVLAGGNGAIAHSPLVRAGAAQMMPSHSSPTLARRR